MSLADIMYLRWIIGFSILFVLRDWYIIKVKKRSPDHGRGLTMRAFIAGAISMVIAETPPDMIENLVASFFIVGFIFMYGLNIATGKNLMYLSSTSNDTDKILLKVFKTPLAVFGLALIGFIGALCIKIFGIDGYY